MNDWRIWLSGLLILLGITAGCVSVVFAYDLLRRLVAAIRYRPRPRKMDYTNMMILFQSMRDILEEQKALARQLTEGIDKRISQIRQTVEETRAELAAIREKAHALAAELETRRPPDFRQPEAPPSDRTASPQHNGHSETSPPLRAIATPEASPRFNDMIDNWIGLDFGEEAPDAHAPAPPPPPEMPENPDMARQAFRTLLNYQEAQPPPADPSQKNQRGGNGSAKITPLQARVYEYCDAGMPIPLIAQELGIGKGEVRLILSLRRDKGH